MPDLDQLLTPEVGDAAAQAVRYPEFSVIERRAAQRRRSRTALTLSVAAVAVGLAVAGSLQVAARDGASPTLPAHPTPTPTAAPLVNGRLQSLDDYLVRIGQGCGGCADEGEAAFEQSTGRVLLTSHDRDTGGITSLRAVGPQGQLAHLTCPHDFACRSELGAGRPDATLGPGPEEITFVTPAQLDVQVLGFDGTARRTLSLAAALLDHETIGHLAWSPDGRRLAVQTDLFLRSGIFRRIWLVDRYGGAPRLAYTARYAGTPPAGKHPMAYVWSLSWSPDSTRLAFVEEHAHLGGQETSVSERVMSLRLPEPGQGGPGTATALYDLTPPPSDPLPWVAWSPDGTRLAVRLDDAVVELPAAGGNILTRHALVRGVLIWSAQRSRTGDGPPASGAHR